MIKCPICKEAKDIISETPSWDLAEDEYVVEVQSHCISCRIDFETKHSISEPTSVKVVEENKSYPWGA